MGSLGGATGSQLTPRRVFCKRLLAPPALTHSHAHPVCGLAARFPFPEQALGSPSSTPPVLYFLLIQFSWNAFLSDLSIYFSPFHPPATLCPPLPSPPSSSMLRTMNFRKPIPSRVKIKCFFPLQQVFHYRTHHRSCFIPEDIPVFLLY